MQASTSPAGRRTEPGVRLRNAGRGDRPRIRCADCSDCLIGMMSGSARRLRVRKVCEGSLGFRRRRPHPLEGAVDGGPADAEEFSEFGLGVGAEVVQLEQVFGLVRLQLRLLAAQPAVGFCDLHPLPGPHPDQVRELSHHRQHVEQQPAHRVGRIMD